MEVKNRRLVMSALFIALSFVGSYIKIFGTIAFDSLPGFLAALLFGPFYGAAVGSLGHLFTALTSGFPLTIPIHIVISLSMAITMLGFGATFKTLKGKASEAVNFTAAGLVGVVLNGPVSLAFTMGALAVTAGKSAAMGMMALLPFLVFASAANIVMCVILFKSLERVWVKI